MGTAKEQTLAIERRLKARKIYDIFQPNANCLQVESPFKLTFLFHNVCKNEVSCRLVLQNRY
jgi:hypothetical protein